MSAVSHTLAHAVQLAQDIKKSRFVAHAFGVTTPAEALEFLAQVSDVDATHNCWAYRIGQQYRFSDDGEPGGTAGRPILQAIEGQGYDRVVVVVTRWYGGIKLGAGGLARAYGGCAAECLRTADRVAIIELREIEVWLPFAALAPFHARLGDFAAERRSESFDADGASLRLALPPSQIAGMRKWLADLSRGRAILREAD